MKIDFEPDRAMYPFGSKWFDSSAGWVHYIDEGSGTPILFCHGNPTWSFLYRGIVSRSATGSAVWPSTTSAAACPAPGGLRLHDRGTRADHRRAGGPWARGLHHDGSGLGGPVSMAVATQRAGRVSGVVLGNTWFWPASLYFRFFSSVMGSGLMQRKILEQNFFVEKLMPPATARKLSEQERDHYRKVQPMPEARRGVAKMPKQIIDATPLLERLSRDVPEKLGSKPALIVWGLRDRGFRPSMIPRMRRCRRCRTEDGEALHPGGCACGDRGRDREAFRLGGSAPRGSRSRRSHLSGRWPRSP